jgi:hypothetical protein
MSSRLRWSSALWIGCLGLAACFQKLDEQAATAPPAPVLDPAGGSGAKFPIITDTPPIELGADSNGDPTATTTNACDKVIADALAIRTADCSPCHEAPATQGLPLDFVLDDKLISAVSQSTKYEGRRYIVPGDPDGSLLYQRAAITRDMPPSGDIRNTNNRPTVSDFSVLREWITSCAGAPPAGDGGDGGAEDDGADGGTEDGR